MPGDTALISQDQNMTPSDELYACALERISQAISRRRADPDYYAVNEGDFVVDHDVALARAAAEAVDLRRLLDALCQARTALRSMEDERDGARAA
jgi:hypothetical protein